MGKQRKGPCRGITNLYDKEPAPAEMADYSSSVSATDLNTVQVVEAYQRAKLRLAELNIDPFLPRSSLSEVHS